MVADVRGLFDGEPVYLAGSLVAAEAYGMGNNGNDVDVFCPTSFVLVSQVQRLVDRGFVLDDKFKRVWYRWLRYGFKSWHTNSVRLETTPALPVPVTLSGVEFNLVYKLTDGHPTTSLAQVLESFDFGLLAIGYDMEQDRLDQLEDYRRVWWPRLDPMGPLPMMRNKRRNWRQGFVSRYNGLREMSRYAKYHVYGYDMSLVKDDLVVGYLAAADYLTKHHDPDKQKLGEIYDAIAGYIDADDIDQLVEAGKQIEYSDSLDEIMAELE
jgi:hypothetical protein